MGYKKVGQAKMWEMCFECDLLFCTWQHLCRVSHEVSFTRLVCVEVKKLEGKSAYIQALLDLFDLILGQDNNVYVEDIMS